MTKSIDEMDLQELRDALRWERSEKKRIIRKLTDYRETVLGAVGTIRNAS